VTRIQPAAPGDAQAIADIYNVGIAERSSTFETEPRTAAEVEQWLAGAERHPVLVAAGQAAERHPGAVLGWARILPYSPRPAYAGVGEVSVYVAAVARGHGIGSALMHELEQRAAELGYWKLVGKLFTDNAASAALVRRCGWREVGLHLRHGRLDGEWRDVLVVERSLDAG